MPLFIRVGSSINLGDLNREWLESVATAKNRPGPEDARPRRQDLVWKKRSEDYRDSSGLNVTRWYTPAKGILQPIDSNSTCSFGPVVSLYSHFPSGCRAYCSTRHSNCDTSRYSRSESSVR